MPNRKQTTNKLFFFVFFCFFHPKVGKCSFSFKFTFDPTTKICSKCMPKNIFLCLCVCNIFCLIEKNLQIIHIRQTDVRVIRFFFVQHSGISVCVDCVWVCCRRLYITQLRITIPHSRREIVDSNSLFFYHPCTPSHTLYSYHFFYLTYNPFSISFSLSFFVVV